MKPYYEEKIDSLLFREFDQGLHESELVWHRDKEDRHVLIIDGLNWKLQLDNEVPFILEKGKTYFIPKMVYHRLHKGFGTLEIRIQENL